jgi:hypothetical protein
MCFETAQRSARLFKTEHADPGTRGAGYRARILRRGNGVTTIGAKS